MWVWVGVGMGLDRLLVGREGEVRPLRDDLREGGGALPAAAELPDAVDAAEVGEGGERVRARGPAGNFA